jgi:hypothetical protein
MFFGRNETKFFLMILRMAFNNFCVWLSKRPEAIFQLKIKFFFVNLDQNKKYRGTPII